MAFPPAILCPFDHTLASLALSASIPVWMRVSISLPLASPCSLAPLTRPRHAPPPPSSSLLKRNPSPWRAPRPSCPSWRTCCSITVASPPGRYCYRSTRQR